MKHIMLIGLGGFAGSIGRYVIGGWVHRALPAMVFPIGTLTVNTIGCLLIGLVGGWTTEKQAFSPELRVFLMIGVLGGFTTFSSFAYETLALARDAEMLRAFGNIALHVVVGLAAAWIGYALVRS